jgi:hypothetical protein
MMQQFLYARAISLLSLPLVKTSGSSAVLILKTFNRRSFQQHQREKKKETPRPEFPVL